MTITTASVPHLWYAVSELTDHHRIRAISMAEAKIVLIISGKIALASTICGLHSELPLC